MSAFLCLIDDQGIRFFSDAIGYDDDGVVLHLGSKVELRPDLPAIIGARGSAETSKILTHIASWRDFDHLVSSIEKDGRRAFDIARMNRTSDDPPYAQIWIAGWSTERERYCLFVIDFSIDRETGDVLSEPLTEYEGIFHQPGPNEEACRRQGWDGGVPIVKQSPPERTASDVIRVFEAIRDTRNELHHLPNAPKGVRCGGWLQMTVLTHVGIWTQVIHRWPDAIGEVAGSASAESGG
jgi:hypothetical protein